MHMGNDISRPLNEIHNDSFIEPFRKKLSKLPILNFNPLAFPYNLGSKYEQVVYIESCYATLNRNWVSNEKRQK